MGATYFGVSDNEDLSPGLIKKDTRGPLQVFRDMTFNHAGHVQISAGLGIVLFPFFQLVMLSNALIVLALFYHLYALNKHKKVLLQQQTVATADGKQGKGLFYLGNSRSDNTVLFLSDPDMRAHIMAFGTTGAGKSVWLLSMLYQAAMYSGAMYVDGKGDNSVWWQVFTLMRAINRVDSLLLINYLTAGTPKRLNRNAKYDVGLALNRTSNTTNSFSDGPSDQLRGIIMGLTRDSGNGGDMWKGRASFMMGTLLSALVELRDSEKLLLSVNTIRDYITLDKIVELSNREDLTPKTLDSLHKYLVDLPGYREQDAELGEIAPKAYEQHSYLTMQVSESLADLGEVYNFIFGADLGEVDYKDVVFNRRVLFVLLPSLTKDPDALAGLGKLIITGIRSALGPALGDQAQGRYQDIIGKKPTKSETPFLMILDEYGYYSVVGFAIVAAQARSLGVSVIYASQDYPSLAKSSESEAKSTVANTNTKIVMKLQDPQDTLKVIQEAAGKAYMNKLPGYEDSKQAVGALYRQMRTTQIELVDRINLRDLTTQGPGKAHVLHADTLVRSALCYFSYPDIAEVRINQFIQVAPPSAEDITRYLDTRKTYLKLFGDGKFEYPNTIKRKMDSGIAQLFNDFSLASQHDQTNETGAKVAIGIMELRAQLKDRFMEVQSLRDNTHSSDLLDSDEFKPSENYQTASTSAVASQQPQEESQSMSDPSLQSTIDFGSLDDSMNTDGLDTEPDLNSDELKALQDVQEMFKLMDQGYSSESDTSLDDNKSDFEPPMVQHELSDAPIDPSESLHDQALNYQTVFIDLVNTIEQDRIAKLEAQGTVLTPTDKESQNPRNRLQEIENMHSQLTGEPAQEDTTLNIISKEILDIQSYAEAPVPTKADQQELMFSVETFSNLPNIQKRLQQLRSAAKAGESTSDTDTQGETTHV